MLDIRLIYMYMDFVSRRGSVSSPFFFSARQNKLVTFMLVQLIGKHLLMKALVHAIKIKQISEWLDIEDKQAQIIWVTDKRY